MTSNELRQLFINFFVKQNKHTEISGASLIPDNDPTVLFITAGMHPLVPYLMGEKHPSGTRLVNSQKCIRTGDIDEVGDNTHLTFFEMLGNWSLGDYFKEESIQMSYKFLTQSREDGGLGFSTKNLAFTCFKGDNNAPKDVFSVEMWESLGIDKDRIAFLGKEDNWWGPAGQTGPCGPDTEIFYWTGDGEAPKVYDPEDERWVEIWNNVFMEYNKNEDGTFTPMEKKNVDTGMGLARVLSIINGVKSSFDTPIFADALAKVRILAGYTEATDEKLLSERIIVDHIRTATFILGDNAGITPSNTDQGYILRRLIRRAIRHAKKLGITGDFTRKLAEIYVKQYGEHYTELSTNQNRIFEEIVKEEMNFSRTLDKGLGILQKETIKLENRKSERVKAFKDDFFFDMFATYGFPVEATIEELKNEGFVTCEADKKYILENFNVHFKKHQALSKSGAEKKFSGGLADNSEAVTNLHTATHLLHKALKIVLGDHVAQKGSNITADRLRFDFAHDKKMTPEQKVEVEKIINEQIQNALPISYEEMTVEEAKALGAIGLFEAKYGEKVKVYSIGNREDGTLFSLEICGGPHAKNTKDLVSFKIKKEQSSSSGVRRIKAVIGK